VVVSIETIEHLENPRALFRELVRALRPRGLLLVTTPNQLSVLSKLSFVEGPPRGVSEGPTRPTSPRCSHRTW
jgi:2-polyprenyl-3-methyl-5-hydroxy-6-metoxy-1,4-benzoquinol methylase